MNVTLPLIDSSDRSVSRNVRQSNRFLNLVAVVLTLLMVFSLATRHSGIYSQYISQYNYRQMIWSDSNLAKTKADAELVESSSISTLIASSTILGTTTQPATTTLTTATATIPATIPATTTLAAQVPAPPSLSVSGVQNYITVSFGATCSGGGISNKLYEIVSLYGIARTLNRVPYANSANDCILNHMKEMTSYFPQIALAIELKVVSKELTTAVVFGSAKCCTYEDVGTLFAFNTSRFIALSATYLQSYKFFNQYRADVLKLLSFTDEDIAVTDKIAKETFKNDTNHKVCVHIRRGDYLRSSLHQVTTEDFTMASVLYVREKLMKSGVNATVALLGDDRPWAKALFANFTWAHVPDRTNRPTTDYAFVARHCQTVIITASASTFGFWSAYLSSAESVYYNENFAKSAQLANEMNAADVFLPAWISLRLDGTTKVISEVPR